MRELFVLFIAVASAPALNAQQQPQPSPPTCCARVEIIANRSAGFDRVPEYMSVWIEPDSRHWAFHPTFVAEAREAFHVWTDAGVPIIFDFTSDSTKAMIRLYWRNRLSEGVTGRSTWWKAKGALGRVDMEVALAAHHGIDAPLVRAVVMHEIGHLLGFSHTNEPNSIMSYYISRPELSRSDLERMRRRFALSGRP